MVIDFIQQIGVPRTENKYLHFARLDKVASLEEIEGVVFLANPDMLSYAREGYYDYQDITRLSLFHALREAQPVGVCFSCLYT